MTVFVGTSAVLKFALCSNRYYNWKKIYQEFIYVKDILCHISGMTSGLSKSGKIRGIVRIASGDQFY